MLSNKSISDNILLENLLDIHGTITLIKEPKIPFPQADVFELFLQICETLFEQEQLSRDNIMEMFNLKPRQYNFYISAGEYLGLIEKNNSNFIELSQRGLGIFGFDEKDKKLSIVKLILQHKPFYDVFAIYIITNRIPTKNEIFEVLKRNNIYNLDSDVTLKRRSATVYNWINWIINLTDN